MASNRCLSVLRLRGMLVLSEDGDHGAHARRGQLLGPARKRPSARDPLGQLNGDEITPAARGPVAFVVHESHGGLEGLLQRALVSLEEVHDDAPDEDRHNTELAFLGHHLLAPKHLDDAVKNARQQVEAELLVHGVLLPPDDGGSEDARDEGERIQPLSVEARKAALDQLVDEHEGAQVAPVEPREPRSTLDLREGVPCAKKHLHNDGVGNTDPCSVVQALARSTHGRDETAVVGTARGHSIQLAHQCRQRVSLVTRSIMQVSWRRVFPRSAVEKNYYYTD